MAKSSQSDSRSFLSSQRRDGSEGLSRTELEKLKRTKKQENKVKNSYFPFYFEDLIYRCEILTNSGHNNPSDYVLPSLFKLSNLQESIRRRNIVESHMLDTAFESIVHSKDKADQKKKMKYYNNLIQRYTDG